LCNISNRVEGRAAAEVVAQERFEFGDRALRGRERLPGDVEPRRGAHEPAQGLGARHEVHGDEWVLLDEGAEQPAGQVLVELQLPRQLLRPQRRARQFCQDVLQRGGKGLAYALDLVVVLLRRDGSPVKRNSRGGLALHIWGNPLRRCKLLSSEKRSLSS
jgi:hypothetical protein